MLRILEKENEVDFIKQLKNAKLTGGMLGETFDIICSLFKTYKISNPSLFNLDRLQAEALYSYANKLGRDPRANFDLIQELSW
jgi:AAA+ superfamily predicted ATPase